MLEITALGDLGATHDGLPVDLGGPRQRAVLARLVAAGGQPVAVERIVEDLWAGEPPARAQGALQAYVSNLRRALEPERPARAPATVLVTTATGYALRLPEQQVDAWRFGRQLELAQAEPDPAGALRLLDDALSVWRGRALAEVADSAWAAPVVARLEEQRLVAVEQRAARQLALGMTAAAVPGLEQHVHDSPLREEGVRLLVLALYRCGRQADALAALRQARTHLRDELGIDPGPALRALEQAVLDQSAELELPSVSAPVPHPAHPPREEARPALLGRTSELRRLHAAAAVAMGGGRLALVEAEAGAGKTTLLQGFCADLEQADWQLAWARCPEVDGAPPAVAWADALTRLTRDVPAGPALARWLEATEGQGGSGAGPDREGDAFRTARAIAGHLRTLARRAPVCIVLDDAHRADDLTLQVLRQVLADTSELPVLVLAAFRRSEATTPLDAAVAALAGATAERLLLPGLTPAAVGELLDGLGVPVPDPDQLQALAERTDGNPLFVREIGRLLLAEGRSTEAFAVPPGVRDVLRARVARLPAPARGVLRLAAVLGRDVSVDVLLRAHHGGDEEILDGLEAGVLAGLLDEPCAGRVRFTHALVRETLYDELPLVRRSRLHAGLVDALEDVAPHDCAALAHHAMAGLTPATAARASRHAAAAARQAEAVTAWTDATRLWRQAVTAAELAASAPGDPSDLPGPAGLVRLLLREVPAAATAGDSNAARAARARALRLARGLVLDGHEAGEELVLQVLTCWRAPVVWTTRELCTLDETHLAALHAALARDDLAPDVRARLLCDLVVEMDVDQLDELLQVSAEALALARTSGDDRLLCLALTARNHAVTGPDHVLELEQVGTELLELARRLDDPGWEGLAHHVLFKAAWERGDLDAAQRHIDAALESASAGQVGQLHVVTSLWTAMRALMESRPEAAAAAYERGFRQLQDIGGANAGVLAVMGRFVTGHAAGDASGSVQDLRAMEEVVGDGVAEPLALALLDAGRVAEAREVWRPERPLGRDLCWLAWTAVRGDIAVRLGDVDVARKVYAELLPWAGRWAGVSSAALLFGPVPHYLGRLALLLGDTGAAALHAEQCARLLVATTEPGGTVGGAGARRWLSWWDVPVLVTA